MTGTDGDDGDIEVACDELAIGMLSLRVSNPEGWRGEDEALFIELLKEADQDPLNVALSMMNIAWHALELLGKRKVDDDRTPVEWLQAIAAHLQHR